MDGKRSPRSYGQIQMGLLYCTLREMVERPVFQEHFWWCYDQFRQEATEDIGVPGYFRFMTLLGELL